jgi:hypothetical protein
VEAATQQATDVPVRDRPIVLGAIAFDERARDLAHRECLPPVPEGHHDVEELGFRSRFPLGGEVGFQSLRDDLDLGAELLILHDGEERNEDLIETRREPCLRMLARCSMKELSAH